VAAAHEPTDATRIIARTLSAYGVTHEDIAAKLEISADTLVKHYKRELDAGRIDANSRVAERLYQIATQKETDKASVTAMMFWLKTRAGWREVQRHEVEIKTDVASVLEARRQRAEDQGDA
jgi:DNA-binding transcriptional ArsR family regulator